MHLSSKPVRVCDACFTKLNENQLPNNGSKQNDFFSYLLKMFFCHLLKDSRNTSQRDSSESDGEENTQPESPAPVRS